MEDFQSNLENSLSEMELIINYMVEWTMNDLGAQMSELTEELEEFLTELPNRITSSLDKTLETFFERLDTKSLTDAKYIENLTKLNDKITKLEMAFSTQELIIKK